MAASALDVHRPLRPAPSSCSHSLPPLIPFPLLRALKIKTIREIHRKKRRAWANSNDAAILRRARRGKKVREQTLFYVSLLILTFERGGQREGKREVQLRVLHPGPPPHLSLSQPSHILQGGAGFAHDAAMRHEQALRVLPLASTRSRSSQPPS